MLIEFQTIKYETYIHPFIDQFKLVDTDMDGALDEKEFKELLVALDIWEEAATLIESFEPHNLKQITLTEVIGVFSSETVEIELGSKDRIPILEKICKDHK